MKFYIMDDEGCYPEKEIEINTLSELMAFADGGTGRIEIDHNAIDYDGNKLRLPIIHRIKYLHWRENEEQTTSEKENT